MLNKTVSRTRRELLKITGYSAMAGVSCLIFGRSVLTVAGSDTHAMLSESMKVIGKAYLEKYPSEGSRSALLTAIRCHSSLVDLPAGELIATAWNRIIIEDFSMDDVVYLNGWALSRSEARLAALTIV